MTTKFRIHLILIKVEEADTSHEKHDILEEEELAGYRLDFEFEEAARIVFSAFSGVNVDSTTYLRPAPKPATRKELEVALQAYRESVLEEEVEPGSGKTRTRKFTDKDAKAVQIGLGLRDLQASIGQILHVAQLMELL